MYAGCVIPCGGSGALDACRGWRGPVETASALPAVADSETRNLYVAVLDLANLFESVSFFARSSSTGVAFSLPNLCPPPSRPSWPRKIIRCISRKQTSPQAIPHYRITAQARAGGNGAGIPCGRHEAQPRGCALAGASAAASIPGPMPESP